ncbi:MAG: bifunctional 2-polyprenyl-6-hydroxyphenol methylase/3-demethylubiquinol 3-O-methyltransferase UbiG [Beijerinckiaceae bacterium]|nr:bifunctional 2-polyprenyl-6-hydroxyphenol methylase/3-demethylubiquinol 3-O-methyltransferase UbiG [Beijerinckiaceae bacterium]
MQMQENLGPNTTVKTDEVGRFDRLAAEWWDPEGPMRALHKFNPARVAYLRELLSRHFPCGGNPRDWRAPVPLQGLAVLDIGCGAGILSEPLARLGARMTAIDPARRNIEAAREHAAKANLAIDYRCAAAEDLAAEGASFDAVLAMEVIEHVRDAGHFINVAGKLVNPGGMLVAATLNRTLKSFALAIVGAEYVLNWVPRGTHDWNHFITPKELAGYLRAAGLRITDETGVIYDPLARKWRLSHDLGVNYMMSAIRPE